jgi:hypothetical protein
MKYETIDGYPARIICDDLENVSYPIAVAYQTKDGEAVESLTEDLKKYVDSKEPFLVEVDTLRDLKRVKSEGARIEVDCGNFGWQEKDYLTWTAEPEKYRILGGISIESWDAHSPEIKAFWNGAEIVEEIDGLLYGTKYPTWDINKKYRVKPTTKKVTLKEVAEQFNVDHIEIVEDK